MNVVCTTKQHELCEEPAVVFTEAAAVMLAYCVVAATLISEGQVKEICLEEYTDVAKSG